ncbi:MAG: transporter substrate-binding domain-containing protein [Cyanobacteria bacterium]|nr:transporter substrate-binding domain-containing protein [Cyanobacteria bacterium CG_2015-16_32_12]NCO79119.1 transporter substrate-binding domain-containing protein [Cyanobacteria bacterium CG_2015-22_32_23]NCQ03696.1 transporter substrate-binding domain-containing protein [Cyanobacteria bacterium CG_2015-09_32_10]NCQ40466.1 transporter substrate-binding domain-containing protein [Cyanobacteria bacterium CG_2015-04_32_10]NCS84943.1 transporter substrate-binding domain-containing protein [Cya
MLKKIFITSLMGLLLSTGVKPSIAGTVVENIAKTGTFTVATPFNTVPYSYYNPENELTGFSIDVVKLIHQQLEKELGRKIELNFVEVNSLQEAIPKMISGEADIACNAVFTWERDKYVDYTLRYTISGIRLLIPKGKIPSDSSFANKKIGIPPQTFVRDAIKLNYPNAVLVDVKSLEEGTNSLNQGKIDALAGDSILLDGFRQQVNPDGFEQFPPFAEPSLAQYGVGCIVPENNSAFLNIANYSIARMMEGYLVKDPEMTQLFQKWMGENGVVNIVSNEGVELFFKSTIINHEQIPFPKK